MLFKNLWFRLALVITGVGSVVLGLILMANQAAMGEYVGSYHAARAYGYGHHGVLAGAGFFGFIGFLIVLMLAGPMYRRVKGHKLRQGYEGQGNQVDAIRDPLEALSESYAAGELSREVYLERRAVLEEKV